MKSKNDIIIIENLSYAYPKSKELVLKNINLRVKEGEFLAIMGKTGAGKTTLCLALNGIIPQFYENGKIEGEVIVDGLSTYNTPIQKLALSVGMVFQDFESQIFGVTVEEDIGFGLSNIGLPKEEILRRINEVLSIVRLNGYEKREVGALSGGELQRLAIADILAMKPKILVLDEPTSQLDPIGKEEVFSVILSLKEKLGITTIITEHKSEEIAQYADRVIVLKNGEIALEGHPKDLFKKIDELYDLGVRPPQVCELSVKIEKQKNINFDSFPLTVDEAYKTYINALSLKKINKQSRLDSINSFNKAKDLPIIEVEDLWHTYPNGIHAIQGISLKIYKGEFLAIIGQNGSGKTTLVKHFNGLLKPTKGKVIVGGVNTLKSTVGMLSRKVGYVFQNPDHQIFATSVYEEIAYGPKNMKLSKEEIDKRVKEALNFVGLEGYEEKNPFLLNKGERQRIAFASIFAMRPQVFIVDEPTTGQDYQGSENMMKMLKKLNEKGCTIIIITHDMRIVAEYAQRIIVLSNGKILADGPTRAIFSQPELLKKSFLAPPQITQLSQKLVDYGFKPYTLSVDEMFDQALKILEDK
ncbi:MAG: energy-coupling factor transporter ATPase [Candidatus Bathyarchaeia archaeon]